MQAGFYIILAAQFFSALADNALLFAAIALLAEMHAPDWQTPVLHMYFVFSYIVLAPLVGPFADAVPKGRVMFVSNGVKLAGCLAMLAGLHPLYAYGLVGIGAAMYSPAKYGILTEYLPSNKLVWANGWMEGLTVAAIILGAITGGALLVPSVNETLDLSHHGLPFIDSPGKLAVAAIVLLYVIAAVFNLYIPRLAADRKPPPQDHPVHPARLLDLLLATLARPAGTGFPGRHHDLLGRGRYLAFDRSELVGNHARLHAQ